MWPLELLDNEWLLAQCGQIILYHELWSCQPPSIRPRTHTHTAHMFGLNGKCGFGMRRRRARLSFRAAHGKRRRRRGLLRQRHRQLESTRRRSEQTCNLWIRFALSIEIAIANYHHRVAVTVVVVVVGTADCGCFLLFRFCSQICSPCFIFLGIYE